MIPARTLDRRETPESPGVPPSGVVSRAKGLRLRRQRLGRDGGADPIAELARRVLDGARSGQSGSIALVEAVDELDAIACPPSARRAARELRSGRPAPAVMREWQARALGSTERLLVTALLVTARTGGSLVAPIETAAALAHDAGALEARRQALLAPARATTAVLVILPVLFAVFASIISGAIIYRGPIGAALLVTGVALDLLGLQWMRRLQARFGR